ncbi:MAG TPA: hypothetical protein VM432_11895 [Bdellovibrionales bacterium]|nr:hypothetical protein [Bdellovibrionales bacterium]
MTNERFFKLLTIAVLGFVALAFVPNLQADESEEAALLASMPELESLNEIEQINAGQFQPYILDTNTSSTVDVTALDPNQ